MLVDLTRDQIKRLTLVLREEVCHEFRCKHSTCAIYNKLMDALATADLVARAGERTADGLTVTAGSDTSGQEPFYIKV